MHEYSIVQALLARVEQEARTREARAVVALTVQIGELSGVEPDLLAAAWELIRERTLCAGAPMSIRSTPARWSCPSCGGEIRRGTALRCPECQVPARLTAGDEILLERIEMEVA